jgi:hypothetical protein
MRLRTAGVTAVLIVVSTVGVSAQARRPVARNLRERIEDVRDRREDVRDRAEDHRDRREDVRDRIEDRR